MLNFRTPRLLAAAALAAVVGACTGDSPTNLAERTPDARSFASEHFTGESGVFLCKITFMSWDLGEAYDPTNDPTLGQPFSFDITDGTIGSTTLNAANWLALTESDCDLIYEGDANGSLTIVETSPASIMNSAFMTDGFPRSSNFVGGLDLDASTRTLTLDPVPVGERWIVVKNTITDVPQPDPLTVTKTAAASYDRTVEWGLTKSVDPESHSGAPGDAFQSIWTVTATKSSRSNNFQVAGTITVSNSNAFPVDFTLADVLDDGTSATVECPGTGDNTGTVAGNGSVDCSYTASPSDASATSNTVSVASSVGGDSYTAGFSWAETLIGFDEATLRDPRFAYSNPISITTQELFPEQFICPADLTVYTDGLWEETYLNKAYLDVGTETLERQAEVKVTCRIPVCTLTIGYWKTHSENGPAPYDETWALLANGADTGFFLSGMTWYEVFQTPVAGNQYYNLAHQYMGAVLNRLNGASAPSEVDDAIAAAKVLFDTYTPAQIAAFRGNNPIRAQFVALAGTLGSYNEGDIGPGHCEG